MVEESNIAAGCRCDDRSSQDTRIPTFVPPRPRDRRRLGKGDSRAGYWCRRTVFLVKKAAVTSREAREAKEKARQAKEVILMMQEAQMQQSQQIEGAKEDAREAKEMVRALSRQMQKMKQLLATQMKQGVQQRELATRQLQAIIRGRQGRRAAQSLVVQAQVAYQEEVTQTPHPHTPEGAKSGSSRGSAKGSSPSTDLECGGSPGGVRAGPHIVDDTQYRDVPVQAVSDALAQHGRAGRRAARRLRSACIGPGHQEAMRRRQVAQEAAQEAEARQRELDFERALSRDVWGGGFSWDDSESSNALHERLLRASLKASAAAR